MKRGVVLLPPISASKTGMPGVKDLDPRESSGFVHSATKAFAWVALLNGEVSGRRKS